MASNISTPRNHVAAAAAAAAGETDSNASPTSRAGHIHKARAQRIAPFDKKAEAIGHAFDSISELLSLYQGEGQDAHEEQEEQQEPPAKRRKGPSATAAEEISQDHQPINGPLKSAHTRRNPSPASFKSPLPLFSADVDSHKDEQPDEQAIREIDECLRRAMIRIAGSEGKPNYGVHVGMKIVATHNKIAPDRLAELREGQELQGTEQEEARPSQRAAGGGKGEHTLTPAERLCREDGTLPVFGDDEAAKDLWTVYLIAGEASSQFATAAAAGIPSASALSASGTVERAFLDDDSMTNAVLSTRYAAPHIGGGSNNMRARAYPSLPSWVRPMNSDILPEAGISVQHSGYMSSFGRRMKWMMTDKLSVQDCGRVSALQIFPLHLEHVLEGLEDGDDTLIDENLHAFEKEQAEANGKGKGKGKGGLKRARTSKTTTAAAEEAPQFMGGPWTYLKATQSDMRTTTKKDQLTLLDEEHDVLELMDSLDWVTNYPIHVPRHRNSNQLLKPENVSNPFLPGGVYCPLTIPQSTEKMRQWEEEVLKKQNIGNGWSSAHLGHPFGDLMRGHSDPLLWLRKKLYPPVVPSPPDEEEEEEEEIDGPYPRWAGGRRWWRDAWTEEERRAAGELPPLFSPEDEHKEDDLPEVSMLSDSNVLEEDTTAAAAAATVVEPPPLRSTPIAATRRTSVPKTASQASERRQRENVSTSATQDAKGRPPRFSSHQPGEVLRNSRRGSNRSSLPADAHSSGFLSSFFPKKRMPRAEQLAQQAEVEQEQEQPQPQLMEVEVEVEEEVVVETDEAAEGALEEGEIREQEPMEVRQESVVAAAAPAPSSSSTTQKIRQLNPTTHVISSSSVVEGGLALRSSPSFPQQLSQISSEMDELDSEVDSGQVAEVELALQLVSAPNNPQATTTNSRQHDGYSDPSPAGPSMANGMQANPEGANTAEAEGSTTPRQSNKSHAPRVRSWALMAMDGMLSASPLSRARRSAPSRQSGDAHRPSSHPPPDLEAIASPAAVDLAGVDAEMMVARSVAEDEEDMEEDAPSSRGDGKVGLAYET